MLSLSGSPLSAIPGSMCDEKIMQLQERVLRPRPCSLRPKNASFGDPARSNPCS